MRILLAQRLPDHLLRLLKWLVQSQSELQAQKVERVPEASTASDTCVKQIDRVMLHLSVACTPTHSSNQQGNRRKAISYISCVLTINMCFLCRFGEIVQCINGRDVMESPMAYRTTHQVRFDQCMHMYLTRIN